jgi:hypothetical protein
MSCSGKRKNMKGGSENIPLYSDTSTDWHIKGNPSNLAVDLNVGINEYQFGRPTPDNKFVVSTGLVNKPFGVEMVGSGKKRVKKTKKTKESLSILNKIKKSFTNIVKGISVAVTVKKSNVKKPMKKVTKKPMKKVIKKPMKKVTKKPIKKVTKKPMKKVTKK